MLHATSTEDIQKILDDAHRKIGTVYAVYASKQILVDALEELLQLRKEVETSYEEGLKYGYYSKRKKK